MRIKTVAKKVHAKLKGDAQKHYRSRLGFAGRYYCSKCFAFHSSYTKLGHLHQKHEDVMRSIDSFGWPMK